MIKPATKALKRAGASSIPSSIRGLTATTIRYGVHERGRL
jgi:hypothetical protein